MATEFGRALINHKYDLWVSDDDPSEDAHVLWENVRTGETRDQTINANVPPEKRDALRRLLRDDT